PDAPPAATPEQPHSAASPPPYPQGRLFHRTPPPRHPHVRPKRLQTPAQSGLPNKTAASADTPPPPPHWQRSTHTRQSQYSRGYTTIPCSRSPPPSPSPPPGHC